MRNLQCQRIFQANAPVNSVTLHPNQHELIVGDQNGAVHLWNLRADSSEAHTPEPGSSIQCVTIDGHGRRMAAVTNKGNCYVTIPSTIEQEVVGSGKNLDQHATSSPSSTTMPAMIVNSAAGKGDKHPTPDSLPMIDGLVSASPDSRPPLDGFL